MDPDHLRPGSDQDFDPVSLRTPRPVPPPPWRRDQLRRLEQTGQNCVICLDATTEPCTLFPCEHRCYHYTCISQWLNITPQCPLCKATVSSVVHGPVGRQQTREYYPSGVPRAAASRSNPPIPNPALRYAEPRLSSFQFGPAPGDLFAPRPDEPAGLAFRREVYRLLRYSMHVGANPMSGYREVARERFSQDVDLHTRVRTFLRRELRVFGWLSTPDADDLVPLQGESLYSFRDRKRAVTVERLLGHILRLLQHFEIRGSDGSLENDLTTHLGRENTRLLLHELHSFLRSPHNSLEDWDREVQYADAPEPRNGLPGEGADASGNQGPVPPRGGRDRYAGNRYRDRYRRRHSPIRPEATRIENRTNVSAYGPYGRTTRAANRSARPGGRGLRGATLPGATPLSAILPDAGALGTGAPGAGHTGPRADRHNTGEGAGIFAPVINLCGPPKR
ncbi:putative RING finger protein C16G5.03 [Tolypocladium ophioglossoides CBS 100239]|uniref:RING-type E3 ubiquitin transferase n=1 Tax=Tolypocladium ophioglossoides (strain CBS 100239) TaxID=1163406 RepID=A0A0L0N5M3_TOLOC|nr:putative RING finger protein C16G5.03 [Tolypocladium ophioglossoides CBS 100239]